MRKCWSLWLTPAIIMEVWQRPFFNRSGSRPNDHLSTAGKRGAFRRTLASPRVPTATISTPGKNTRMSLILRVRPADQRAWAEFVARYGPYILTWSQKYYREEAEDITQEVLSKLVSALPTFDYEPGPGKFRAWLKKVIHNLACSMKREHRERPTAAPRSGATLTRRKRPPIW